MTKVRDSLFEYPGFTGTSVAHLRVYRHEGSTVAVVGQLTDNPSTSITNQAEVIIDQLRREYGDDVMMIEHYPPGDGLAIEWQSYIGHGDVQDVGPVKDAVPGTGYSGSEEWRPLSTENVEMLTGEAVETWPRAQYTRPVLLASGTSPA